MQVADIPLADAGATQQLGGDIAMAVMPGDVLALCGALGAGKTTLARGLVRHLAGDGALEVPSPTFTLCQTYELRWPLAHFDLYRVADPAECVELGLDEHAQGVTLIEWPEHAGDLLPPEAVTVKLRDAPSGGRIARLVAATVAGQPLLERIGRSLAIRRFLDRHAGAAAARSHLQGDASTRRYEVITNGGPSRVLMDAPRRPDGPPIADGKPYSRIAHLAEDVIPFVAMANWLRNAGLSAPAIYASDFAAGLLLLEHLGSEPFIDANGVPVADRYLTAVRLLAQLHRQPPPSAIEIADSAGNTARHVVPGYDRPALAIETSLFVDWYLPHAAGRPTDDATRAAFEAVWAELFHELDQAKKVLVLRDFHSPNLIWRENLPFPANLGLLDFQDAVIGPAAYDLAALGQDARVDMPGDLEEHIIETYVAETKLKGPAAQAFRRQYAIMAAQRATKILGIFVRLDRRDGKPVYLRHIPRLLEYMRRNFRHPALAGYRQWWKTHINADLGE